MTVPPTASGAYKLGTYSRPQPNGACPMPPNRLIRILVASLISLVVAAGIVWYQVQHDERGQTAAVPPVSGAEVGGPFTLVDQTGQTVTDRDFRGRFMLVYFGYTFCPDICPTELMTMAQAIDLLGDAGQQVVPIFITIDPERDTVEAMAGYVALFHPRLVGLTGTPDQIAEAAAPYRVYYARAESEDATYYLMDHSSFVYLMDPEGQNVMLFGRGTSPEAMAEAIRERLPGA